MSHLTFAASFHFFCDCCITCLIIWSLTKPLILFYFILLHFILFYSTLLSWIPPKPPSLPFPPIPSSIATLRMYHTCISPNGPVGQSVGRSIEPASERVRNTYIYIHGKSILVWSRLVWLGLICSVLFCSVLIRSDLFCSGLIRSGLVLFDLVWFDLVISFTTGTQKSTPTPTPTLSLSPTTCGRAKSEANHSIRIRDIVTSATDQVM